MHRPSRFQHFYKPSVKILQPRIYRKSSKFITSKKIQQSPRSSSETIFKEQKIQNINNDTNDKNDTWMTDTEIGISVGLSFSIIYLLMIKN